MGFPRLRTRLKPTNMRRGEPAGVWLSSLTRDHPYVMASGMIASISAFGFAAGSVVQTANLGVLYLLAVFVTSLRSGRWPALFCALTSAVTLDFCFVRPYYSFHITDLPYLITLFGFLAVAVITSELASRAHDAVLVERARADAEAARADAEAGRAALEAVNVAKDALLNRIAHELRSPLTAILGRIQMLQKTVENPTELAALAKVELSTRTLARLVGDLLDASRMHVGKFRVQVQPTTLTPTVARVLEDLALSASERGVAVDQDLEAVPDILADPERVEQIVVNLVTNAIKFTPPNGRVSVRLRNTGTSIELVVADTGAGIPPEFLPHVFEPFTQAEDGMRHDGLGLGLAIVKHLVSAHGGRISVQSLGPGTGTTFTAVFPLMPAGTASAEPNLQRDQVVR